MRLTFNFVICFIALFVISGQTLGSSTKLCENAEIISGKMITDVCWSCIFPIKIAGINTGIGGAAPDEATDKSVCLCEDPHGFPKVGVPVSFWEPARLIELNRTPGCLSGLNGTQLPMNQLFRGSSELEQQDGLRTGFHHYHYYSFPLTQMMDLFMNPGCGSDGYMDFDIMYLSEFDPTWNNDTLAFFTHPEAAAVANPVAVTACVADAVSSAAGESINSMFWCAGAWGSIYPMAGHYSFAEPIRGTSLLATRAVASMHRRGLAWQTAGDDALCRGFINPTLPKFQYKMTMMHPMPETDDDHVIGESTLHWGGGRMIPGGDNVPIYLLYRWKDCCTH